MYCLFVLVVVVIRKHSLFFFLIFTSLFQRSFNIIATFLLCKLNMAVYFSILVYFFVSKFTLMCGSFFLIFVLFCLFVFFLFFFFSFLFLFFSFFFLLVAAVSIFRYFTVSNITYFIAASVVV